MHDGNENEWNDGTLAISLDAYLCFNSSSTDCSKPLHIKVINIQV